MISCRTSGAERGSDAPSRISSYGLLISQSKPAIAADGKRRFFRKIIRQYEFDKCVARYSGNFRIRKLPAYEQFLVLAFANAHSYQVKEVKALEPDGKQVALVNSTQVRSVVVPGLTPGIVYALLACAIGGSTGQSDWSDPVSHMAM